MHIKQGDKGIYVSVDHCITLAFYSDINEAAQAQTKDSGTTRSQSSDPDYPLAYGAAHEDMVMSGLCPFYLPSAKEVRQVTCTGVSYDPENEDLVQAFRSIWTTPELLLHKAQISMKSQIIEAFDISIFPKQNKIFFGSDLLQKLWRYLFGQVHSNRPLVLQHAGQWFLMSLATADDFHAAILKF
jgi:hypothetical protein